MEVINIRGLIKSFGSHLVLENINITYHSNIIYGMIGENGAGKTTLFNCIISNLEYDGVIEKKENLSIGYLPAELFFYSFVTGMEYIEFCIKASGEKINKERIMQLNKEFQLPLSKYASEYSTGMKKKLAFMALILQKKDVYILDEPFNGIDLKGCILLKKMIKEMKNEGMTFIISSHQIASLHEICDRIDYLNNRTIVKQFTTESIDFIETTILEN